MIGAAPTDMTATSKLWMSLPIVNVGTETEIVAHIIIMLVRDQAVLAVNKYPTEFPAFQDNLRQCCGRENATNQAES